MEAILPLDTNFQSESTQPTEPKSRAGVLPVALCALLILGALGLGGYIYFQIHSGAIPATVAGMQAIATLETVQLLILFLAIVTFAAIAYSQSRKLKTSSVTIAQQSHDLEQGTSELKKTKGELEYANSQLAHTLFQLQNANLQFDIITGELDAAKRETDTIFGTVRQGLFLLGADGTISAQTSGELKSIFQAGDLARRNFLQVLRPLIPEKRHQTIGDYFEILFDPRKNEKQLAKFNPLKRVELNFSSPDGGFQPKHVEFSFQRILNNNTVTRVMVTALDVTERVKLEEQLREGELLREKQIELLFDLLQVDSAHLHTFLEDAHGAVDKINAIFMEPGSGAPLLQDKVQRVFRIAHNLKSQAASNSLHLFEKTIHQIENQLNELRRNATITNEDLLGVLVAISNFQAQLKDSSELIEKISGLRRSFSSGGQEMLGTPPVSTVAPADAPAATPVAKASTGQIAPAGIAGKPAIPAFVPLAKPSVELVKSVESLCNLVASRTHKQARVEWKLLTDFDSLPLTHRRVMQNALFQLVRNSIVHGIELPEVREKAGKPAVGCITVSLSAIPDSDQLLLLSRDDGAGLNADGIRAKAVREKLIAEDAVLSENDLYALIFEPGFSTSELTEDAGRGVGLDVIRAEVVDQLHGEIQIAFAKDRFTEFGIILPKA